MESQHLVAAILVACFALGHGQVSPSLLANMGVVNSVSSGLIESARCLNSGTTWTDKYIGKFNLNPARWCNATCLRNIPQVTCCMPISPAELDAKFLMYDPEGENRTLSWDEIMAEKAPSAGQIAIVAHGFLESPSSSTWMMRVMNGYYGQGYKVILVDWTKGNQLSYFQAFTNVRTVSAMIAKVIKKWKISDRLLLVGFSLGGQIIGQAARNVKENGFKPVKACHALDPAGPWFTGCPQYAIQRSDCQLVEVIHSSAELIQNAGSFTMNFGTRTKSGHCDYWVNCGFSQGALCENVKFSELVTGAVELAGLSDAEATKWTAGKVCAHNRAAMVYAAQLEGQCNFQAHPCPDCGQGLTCSAGAALNETGVAPFGSCKRGQNVNYYIKSGDFYPHCPESIKLI
ncbi:Pancreatic triacylglycerol lipase [Halotydeus destructor]|nr:Pancreatic triacylglycerol lipase [Halotydeus destructor]